MQESFIKVVLGAYLHDIGKLLRRGGFKRRKNNYQIAHAEYVAEFFEDEKYSNFWREVGVLASLHHARDFKNFKKWDLFSNPEEAKQIAWTIYMADNISSMERIDEEVLDESRAEYIKNAGLRTVFENIFAEGTLTNVWSYFPETLQDTDFSLTDKGVANDGARFDNYIVGKVDDERIKKSFEKLAQKFALVLENLALKYPEVSEENGKKVIYELDMLLQNYFTLVPSDAYKSIGDISLYDHTKTTAAIASALFESGYHLKKYTRESGNSDTQKVCKENIGIIAGDFPGIQKYLFSSMKNQSQVAKRLRMKSMNIQLLNEAVIEYILDQLQLSRANVLMNAGGKFVILIPNYQDKSVFSSIESSINNFFIKEYGSNLKIILIEKFLQIREIFDIQGEKVDTKGLFEEVFRELSAKKYSIYTKDQLNSLFQQPLVEGKKLCSYCGISYIDYLDEAGICDHCKEEIEGGRLLTISGGVAIQYKKDNDFDFHISWDEKANTIDRFYLSFNNWEYSNPNLVTLVKSINTHVPKMENSEIKSFSDLVDNDRSYLCMIKGDIDNMSILLKYGFMYQNREGKEESIYSVSRLVQMSRMLELFFGKYLMTYLNEEFPDVYTVFSGGDDFVFILPFKQRFAFIEALYKAFGNFVAKNEKIHFSLALGVFKDKTPITAVDHNTELLLKQAKQAQKQNLSQESLKKRCIAIYETNYVLPKTTSDFSLDDDLKLDWVSEVSESLLYQWYLELSDMLQINIATQGSEYVKRGARLLYSITRNVKTANGLRNRVIDSLAPIQNPREKAKLRKILLQLTNVLYQNRV